MKIIEKNIKDITPYENNPRNNEDAVEKVAESIKEFGFQQPIVVDKDNVVIVGHTRLKAAERLGLDKVPVVIADELTEEQAKAYRLADNKTNEIATWKFDSLNTELRELCDFNMGRFGFNLDLVPEEIDAYEDNYTEQVPIKATSRIGEIYQLGEHRLMCGDSTNPKDVELLMDGRKADLLFTDPPYNVDISNSKGMTIINDNMDDEKFSSFLNSVFANANKTLKLGGVFYIWHASTETENFLKNARINGLPTKQILIWVKNTFSLTRADYKWKHEPCLYGWREGAAHYFINEFDNPTVIEDRTDFKKMKKTDLVELLEKIYEQDAPSTIIHENKPLKCDLHPTMKPIKMCAELIHNSCRKGEAVLDLFGGSGSTLIACEELERKCFVMEYDPIYCDVIKDRWEKFTGQKAIRING